VAGARIVVTDADDEVVIEVETDADGKATIIVPGEGEFTATLDLDSLPDDAGLPREGGDVIVLGRNRILNIVVGDRERTTTTTSDRLPQLIFNGLLRPDHAICSVGLSLICGTTGL
jgi:branched-chain amino acid transport system permease protein